MPCINYLRLCSKIVTTEPTTTTTISPPPPPPPQPVSFGFCCPPSVCAGCAGLWTSRVVITHIISLSLSVSLSCSCSRERDWAHWPSLWSDDDVLLRFFPLPTPPNLRRRIIEVKATRRRTNNCVLQLRTVGFFGLFHFLSFFFVVQHRTDLTDQIRLSADSGSSVTPPFFPSFWTRSPPCKL